MLTPHGSENSRVVLSAMVRSGFFNAGVGDDLGVAFFRVNDVATQFGVKEKPYKFDFRKHLGNLTEDWKLDPNLIKDQSKRRSWGRGSVYMIGSSQMVVVRANGHHGQGHGDFETITATVPEEDMKLVFDRLYAYNDHIDNPKGALGPDQGDIYRKGWEYLNKDFPLVDRITKCEFVA